MQISVVNARDREDTTALQEMMEANVNSSEFPRVAKVKRREIE